MAKKKMKDESGAVVLTSLSVSDLYALLMFVSADRNRGFNAVGADKKALVDKKFKDIENELYIRTYGYNPFTKEEKMVIDGQKPEEVIGTFEEPAPETFVVTKNVVTTYEPTSGDPQTFVVKKNE